VSSEITRVYTYQETTFIVERNCQQRLMDDYFLYWYLTKDMWHYDIKVLYKRTTNSGKFVGVCVYITPNIIYFFLIIRKSTLIIWKRLFKSHQNYIRRQSTARVRKHLFGQHILFFYYNGFILVWYTMLSFAAVSLHFMTLTRHAINRYLILANILNRVFVLFTLGYSYQNPNAFTLSK